jgi:hypothetical protein
VGVQQFPLTQSLPVEGLDLPPVRVALLTVVVLRNLRFLMGCENREPDFRTSWYNVTSNRYSSPPVPSYSTPTTFASRRSTSAGVALPVAVEAGRTRAEPGENGPARLLLRGHDGVDGRAVEKCRRQFRVRVVWVGTSSFAAHGSLRSPLAVRRPFATLRLSRYS